MNLPATIAKRALAHCRRPAIDFLCDSWRRIARIPFLPMALGAATALLIFMGRTDPYYRYLAIEYGIANTKLAVYWNPAAPAQIRRRDGTLIASTVGEVSASPSMQQAWGMTTKDACTALFFGTFVALLLGLCKSIFGATAGEQRQPASSPLRLETALPSDGNRQHELPFPARNPATGGTNPIPSTAQQASITHAAGAPRSLVATCRWPVIDESASGHRHSLQGPDLRTARTRITAPLRVRRQPGIHQ